MNQVSVSQVSSLKETVGRYGIWSFGLRSEDPAGLTERAETAAELEELGFGALWLGGSPGLRHAVPLVEATSRLVVATGIQSIWDYEAAETASGYAKLEATHPGRFLLGLGVSHAGFAERYRRPYASMVEYLDVLDAAGQPAERRVLAALGPKMLELSASKANGAHPYFVPVEHTEIARGVLGKGPILAPEQAVVIERDPTKAREIARTHVPNYLRLENYANNLRRLGFSEDDLAGSGSDKLVDAIVAWGSLEDVVKRVQAHLDAGADHVCIQVLTATPRTVPMTEWRELAAALLS